MRFVSATQRLVVLKLERRLVRVHRSLVDHLLLAGAARHHRPRLHLLRLLLFDDLHVVLSVVLRPYVIRLCGVEIRTVPGDLENVRKLRR